MKLYDFYNPIYHKGNLPVRVLPFNFIDWFINITPDFKEEAEFEIDTNKMKKAIAYHINNEPISEIACINPNRQIELYENYNQYLWSICYALLVLFDESIQKPILNGNYTGKFDFENPHVKRAIELFNRAMGLATSYEERVFFELPNPEKYNEFERFYIEPTNGIYTAAMTFILLHEFAHQYYGHLDYYATDEQSKKDEYTADEFAIEKMSHNFNSERGATLKFGIIAGLSSLILLDETLEGGDRHPDPDERLKNAIEKLKLQNLDNIWGISSLVFRLWAIKYQIEFDQPKIVENYKELFYITLDKARELKESR